MCYGAVSWYGKTELRLVEGYVLAQDHLPPSKKKKKTVNQTVYREEMCPLMFADINRVMTHTWTWQQDGAKPHTASRNCPLAANKRSRLLRPFRLGIEGSRSECHGLLYLVTSALTSAVCARWSQFNRDAEESVDRSMEWYLLGHHQNRDISLDTSPEAMCCSTWKPLWTFVTTVIISFNCTLSKWNFQRKFLVLRSHVVLESFILLL